MIIKKFRVHGVRVGARWKFDGRAGQTRKPCQHGNGRVGLQSLRDEARRVAKPYGMGPAGHQNVMPRTSLGEIETEFIAGCLYTNSFLHSFLPLLFIHIKTYFLL